MRASGPWACWRALQQLNCKQGGRPLSLSRRYIPCAVRKPASLVVRGRVGGGGDPFNLGEATVSRATVRLASGEIGHGQLLGNDREKARLAAIFDALYQQPEYRPAVDQLIDAVESRIHAEDRKHAEQTAATRVDFFTMVRGDN